MTESPEIKTYTPTEAQKGGEGKEPAPDGLYIWSDKDGATIANLTRHRGLLSVEGFGWMHSVGFDEMQLDGTFTGPISPDEIIPAVTEHRIRKRLEEERTNHPVAQAAIAEKAHRVAGDALQTVLPSINFGRATKARYPKGEDAREVAWLAKLFLEMVAANLRDGKYLAEGIQGDG